MVSSSAGCIAATKLCEPPVAALFAVILFAEIPSVLQMIGGIITIGGVLLYSQVERKG